MNDRQKRQVATQIRRNILRMTTAAGSGHPTSSLSAVELMTGLLFGEHFHADLRQPKNPDNDRLIFSKGHASPLLYTLYHAAGVVSGSVLMQYRSLRSPLQGHPMPDFPYAEAPTGSLGQGLSIGVGMALSASLQGRNFQTFVLLGDSETAEGGVWEAAQLAGHYGLHRLTAILDANALGQRGPTMLGHHLKAYQRRWESFGWRTVIIDGHSLRQVEAAYATARKEKHRPTIVLARTVKGKGISFLANKPGWHGKALSPSDLARAETELGPESPVSSPVVPPPERATVRPPTTRRAAAPVYTEGTAIAPRLALARGLVRLAPAIPHMIILDGEVGDSTRTDLFAQKFPKRFIEGYIAEQNLVGMAVGMAARGLLPVAATFGAFWSRAADHLRMAGYAGTHQVYIGTHAGVHIGQDGPSQMALEDISLFRSVWGSIVLYPSDAFSAERLLEAALRSKGLVYIRATRAELPGLYQSSDKFRIGGSMTVRTSTRDSVTVVTAGVTLHEALRAADTLRRQRKYIRVIDLYSIKPIDVAALTRAAKETKRIITVEDHYSSGGIGEAVHTALGPLAGCVTSLAVRKLPHSGKPSELLRQQGIDAAAIIRAVRKNV